LEFGQVCGGSSPTSISVVFLHIRQVRILPVRFNAIINDPITRPFKLQPVHLLAFDNPPFAVPAHEFQRLRRFTAGAGIFSPYLSHSSLALSHLTGTPTPSGPAARRAAFIVGNVASVPFLETGSMSRPTSRLATMTIRISGTVSISSRRRRHRKDTSQACLVPCLSHRKWNNRLGLRPSRRRYRSRHYFFFSSSSFFFFFSRLLKCLSSTSSGFSLFFAHPLQKPGVEIGV
jgi:hypothetical protein